MIGWGRVGGWVVVVMGFASCVLGVGSASAASSPTGSGWEVFGYFSPTDLPPGDEGTLHLYVFTGRAVEPNSSPVIVTDRLPAGLSFAGGPCSEGEPGVIMCEIGEGRLPRKRGNQTEPLEVAIAVKVVEHPPSTAAVDRVEVVERGQPGVTDASVPVTFGLAQAGFGISNFDGWFTNTNGTVDTQAGSHPYETTIVFAVNNAIGREGEFTTGGESRHLEFKLPPA